MPKRIQLRRTRGWRKPAAAVVVSRPGKWGNPFKIGSPAHPSRAAAVAAFGHWIATTTAGKSLAVAARRELRGKDLACWCPLAEPCHADVLLRIAND